MGMPFFFFGVTGLALSLLSAAQGARKPVLPFGANYKALGATRDVLNGEFEKHR